jgi:hypothetical protein
VAGGGAGVCRVGGRVGAGSGRVVKGRVECGRRQRCQARFGRDGMVGQGG